MSEHINLSVRPEDKQYLDAAKKKGKNLSKIFVDALRVEFENNPHNIQEMREAIARYDKAKVQLQKEIEVMETAREQHTLDDETFEVVWADLRGVIERLPWYKGESWVVRLQRARTMQSKFEVYAQRARMDPQEFWQRCWKECEEIEKLHEGLGGVDHD
jgi:hypothetical protein